MDTGRLLAWTVFVACLVLVGPRVPKSGAPAPVSQASHRVTPPRVAAADAQELGAGTALAYGAPTPRPERPRASRPGAAPDLGR